MIWWQKHIGTNYAINNNWKIYVFNKSYKKINHKRRQNLVFVNWLLHTIPRIYGLPKTHKPWIPLRLIISGIGTALHNIAKS